MGSFVTHLIYTHLTSDQNEWPRKVWGKIKEDQSKLHPPQSLFQSEKNTKTAIKISDLSSQSPHVLVI